MFIHIHMICKHEVYPTQAGCDKGPFLSEVKLVWI